MNSARAKHKSIVSLMIVLGLMITMCMGTVMTTFAADADQSIIDYVTNNGGKLPANVAEANDSILQNLYSNEANYGIFKINNKTYYYEKAKESDIKAKVSAENASGTTDEITNQLSDAVSQVGVTGADTATAALMLSGFGTVISICLGMIVVLITMLMSLHNGTDIMYLSFPSFRGFCGDQLEMGKSNMTVKKDKDGGVKFRWVTDDAVKAINECTLESGKNPYGIYFKGRVMSYVILSVLMFILLTNNIVLIENLALKGVSGVLKVLGILG